MVAIDAAMLELHGRVEEYFPYSTVRPSQGEFINTIYEALENRSHALLEGSNGLGKTVAALSACLPVAKEYDLRARAMKTLPDEDGAIAQELMLFYGLANTR